MTDTNHHPEGTLTKSAKNDLPEETLTNNAKKYLPEGALMHSAENALALSSRETLERAMRDGRILEAAAIRCDCADMTLTVSLGPMLGYIRREDAAFSPDGAPVKDIAIITRVGHPVCFVVTGFFTDADGSVAARLSRAAAQKIAFERRVSRLVPGDIIDARITHLEPFGAFADVGCGLVSLMTVDAMSVSRISHPRERVLPGELIRCAVREVSPDGRLFLTLRELLGTWEENAALFSPCETVTGIVRSVEQYGVFIELTPNLCGLAEARAARVGAAYSVYIKNIIPERMKIKLVMIDEVPEAPRRPLRYFVAPDETHVGRWRYSPENCPRVIETTFSAPSVCGAAR